MTRRFEEITLRDVATFPRPGLAGPGSFGFTPDSKYVTFLWSGGESLVRNLWAFDPETGRRWILAEAPPESADERNLSREEELRRERARLRETGVTRYQFAKEAPVLLVPVNGRLYVKMGDDPLLPVPGTEGAIDPHLSRDGNRVAFVRDDELWCAELPEGPAIPLTRDAGEGLMNGLAEYIAQEELSRSRGFWWDRTGKRIAAARVDVRHIPPFPIPHHGKDVPEVEEHRYPFAGKPNAKVSLRVIPADGGPPVTMDLGPDEDVYLARVAWRPEGDLAALVLSRDQKSMRWLALDPETGAATTIAEERGEPWLNLSHDTRFLKSGEMLTTSERTGYRHLYLDGRPLTEGDEPVVRLVDLDEERRIATYIATGRRALERRLYAISLDGGPPRLLTEAPGWHDAVFAPNHRLYVHVVSSLAAPPVTTLAKLDGGPELLIHETPESTAEELGLAPPKLADVPAADGTPLWTALYEPPPGDGPRPLVVCVYGGPHAQRVADEWSLTVDLRAQYLARRGFFVLKVDNRGSANRGLAFEAPIHRRMGTVEVEDQAAAVLALGERGDVDLSRVGVYGWSYGGYMTLMMMLRRPDLFRAGVAGAPVVDWDGYDTGYTERYMETPEKNPDGYREASVLPLVDRLAGDLLVVHGMIDENVHFRHTGRLLAALQKAGKHVDLMALPEERHMPRDRAGLEWLETKIARHLARALGA